MARGGPRPGAGRPKGSYTRPQIRDEIPEKKWKLLIEKAVTMAEAGNEPMLKFLLEQRYGKAPQQLEVGGLDGEPLSASLSSSDRKLLTDVRNLLKQSRAK